MTKFDPEMTVTSAELGAILGVSERRVRQLAEAGTIERLERGRFGLGEAVRALIEEASGSGSALVRARTRKLEADATLAELELAVRKGQVANIDEFQRVWADRCGHIRINVLNVPQRVVAQLLGEKDETAFKAKLRAELIWALEQSAGPINQTTTTESEE